MAREAEEGHSHPLRRPTPQDEPTSRDARRPQGMDDEEDRSCQHQSRRLPSPRLQAPQVTVKLPKSLQVGPYTITIEERQGDEMGEYQGDLQRISINPEQGQDAKADSLLHEVLHACFYIAGFRKDFPEPKEERLVSALSSLLLDSLRRNPELVTYLTSR